MPDYEQLLKEAHESVSELQSKLQSLDNVYDAIKNMRDNSGAIPIVFQSKFDEVVQLSEDYLGKVKEQEIEYLKHLKDISKTYLKSYDGQLKKYDLAFSRKINLLKEKNDLLGNHIDNLNLLIERLEKVDLQIEFKKLHLAHGDTFKQLGKVDSTIKKSKSELESSINKLKSELESSVNKLKFSIGKELNSLKDQINRNREDQVRREQAILKGLLQTNKAMKTTWIVISIGFVVTITAMVYLS